MRRALVIATVAALAVARPEMYKEKEDFQYSRSSSDEGSKSGFYGAQRGNMGGNYERAHNMDSLAQHQMGGLVRTVDGELGEGAKQKSGSVFSAANSRGIYGSGHYDLSNLQGRNFQEGTSFVDAQSSSSTSQQTRVGSQSQSYSSAANSAYGSQSQNSRYNTDSDRALYSNNIHAADNLQSADQYDATQLSQASGYNSQSGYQGQSYYDQAAASQQSSNSYGTSNTRGTHYRLVGASPVRVYIRPGGTVTIPVAAQSYDASQGASSIYDQNSHSSSSSLNQNSINSEVEALSTDQQRALKPTNGAKHYESSYSYRKEWEKHDTVTSAPFTMPTANPYPSNSELYEDAQAQGSEQREASAQTRNIQSGSQYRGSKSAFSRQQAAYSSQAQEQGSSSDSAAASSLTSSSSNSRGGYGASANLNSGDLNSQVESFGSKPKSYQSSYSYHKSWERQGDPYVIKPSSNGVYTAANSQATQRLTSSSSNQAGGYGSNYQQGQQGYAYDPNCDCYENGHIRVARSYNLGHDRRSYQQSQNIYEGQEYLGQQAQNLEDLGQQSQNLEDLGQQTQNLQDFGQQSHLQSFGQESQNLEDFGQQSQNLNNLGQQSQKLEDFGQETQNPGQLTQSFDKLGDLDQQAQNQWDQQSQTDAGQQTQSTWSTLETIQHNHGDRNIEQQSNGMDHTGFNNQGPQGSVFEIYHPSMNQAGSHTTQGVNSNPFEHIIFHQQQSGQQPGYHTQYYWQSNPKINQNSQNMHVPLSPLDLQEWQKHLQEHNSLNTGYGHRHHQISYGSNTGTYQTSYNYNSYTQHPRYVNTEYAKHMNSPSSYGQNTYTQSNRNVNTGFNSNPWVLPSLYNNHSNTNFQSTENGNGFTSTETNTTHNNQSNSTTNFVNIPQQTGSSLTNLWDLIDEIEQQTISKNETENSYHTYDENREYVQTNNKLNSTQNLHEYSLNNGNKFHSIAPLPSTTEPTIKTTTSKQDNFRLDDAERGDIEPEKPIPQEESGRGDIGPEDNKPLEILGISPTKPTLDKTPEEIETLNLTKEQKNTKLVNSQSSDVEKQTNLELDYIQHESELGVLSLNDQKKLDHSEQDNWKLQSDIQRTTSTTPSSNHNYEHFNIDQVIKPNQNVNEQHNAGHLDNFGQQGENSKEKLNKEQQNVNINQQNVNHQVSFVENDYVKLQQNTDQQFETTGQETESLEQQSSNNFENMGQQTEDLGQEPAKGQQNEGFQQENLGNFGQQSENFGQQSEGFQQESLGNFGQQSENLGQQSEGFQQESLGNFGQQSESFQQESLGNFGQLSDNVGQQSEGFQQESFGNFGQQSENLGQQSEGFQQESLGNFRQQSENLGQQSEGFQQESLGNFGQQSENFGQQNEGFQQESLGNFGKQSENVGQQSEGFQQESVGNFEQQSDHLAQQSEGFQQEKLGNFGQQSENLGQQSEGFQQESLGNFGQQSENLGQQSEGFQQESLGNFGQQSENLGQQSEGFQQESLGNFGQQSENLGQQSESLQQASLGYFGKHEQFQQEAQIQQLDNLDQESENSEQQSQAGDLWKPNSEKKQTSQVETIVPASAYGKEDRTPPNNELVVEPEFVTQKTNNVDTAPEPVTEKAGFWRKVGSKVKSWFSRS